MARGRALGNQGLQQVESAVTRSKAKGLYDILQGAMTQPDPLTSMVLPLPKRCMWVPTAMFSCPTAQETKAAALGALEQGPLAHPPTSRRQHTCQDGTPTCQCRECPLGLLLLGQGVP